MDSAAPAGCSRDGDQNLGAGLFVEAACFRQRLQQRDRSRRLKRERVPDRAGDADGPAVILRHRDGHVRLHQNAFAAQRVRDLSLHFQWEQAFCLQRAAQHEQPDVAIGIHSYRAAQLGRVINEHGQQIVRPDRLRGQIRRQVAGGGLRRDLRAILRLADATDAEKQHWHDCLRHPPC